MNNKIGFSAIVFLLSVLLISCQSIDKDKGYISTVSVTGSSEVKAEADVASFTIHAEAVKATSEEARSEASLLINNAIDILMNEFGVEKKDLKTSYISISPYYEWKDGGRELKGQSASESVSVKLYDIDKAGVAFERLSSVDGLSLSSISLDKSDKTVLIGEARREAVQNAREKAEAYASSLGLRLGAAITISDGTDSYSTVSPRYNSPMMFKAEAASASVSTSTEYYAGEITVRDSVSVVFALEE